MEIFYGFIKTEMEIKTEEIPYMIYFIKIFYLYK